MVVDCAEDGEEVGVLWRCLGNPESQTDPVGAGEPMIVALQWWSSTQGKLTTRRRLLRFVGRR